MKIFLDKLHLITKSNTTTDYTKTGGYLSTSEKCGGFSLLDDFKITGSSSEGSCSVAILGLAVSESAESGWADLVVTVVAVWLDSFTSASSTDCSKKTLLRSDNPGNPEMELAILESTP